MVGVGTPDALAAPSTKERLTARKLAGEAMDLQKAGDFQAAYDKFAEANALVPAPTLQLRMARCLDKLDRLQEAAEIYRGVIAYELDRKAPAVHRQARKDAVPELSALLEQVPKVVVSVEGPDATGATVTRNEEPFSAELLGQEHALDPGVHRFEARVGDRTVSESVDLERGKTERVALALPMLPDPIDEPADQAPQEAGGSDTMTIAGWSLVGVGGVGLVIGAATGIVVLSKQSDLEERCVDRACPPEAHEDAREFDRLRVTTTVGLVVGGLAGAAGTTLLILSAGGGDEGDVAFFASPFGAGVKGTF